MNPDYLNQWPESYPITALAVLEHLYGRPRIGDPAMWRRCAEDFLTEPYSGICAWMNNACIHGTNLSPVDYFRLAAFFSIYMRPQDAYLWPRRAEFAPRRAALCRTVAALLEELQLNPPADESAH